jgi:hypothetical protein
MIIVGEILDGDGRTFADMAIERKQDERRGRVESFVPTGEGILDGGLHDGGAHDRTHDVRFTGDELFGHARGAFTDAKTMRRRALYEPVHGSAPDIAGTGAANPIAMIASFAMALRCSFGLGDWAEKLETAIARVLAKGIRTRDIAGGMPANASTSQMGEAILSELMGLA